MPEHLRGIHHDLPPPPPCEACNGHGMVGRPLDDDPGAFCLDCRGTGRMNPIAEIQLRAFANRPVK